MSLELVYEIVIIVAFIYWLLTLYRKQQSKIKLKAKFKQDFGKKSNNYYDKRDYDNVKKYFNYTKSDNDIDDITWDDLNFDDMFNVINRAKSNIGDEYTYKFLRQQHNKDLNYFENAINEMNDKEDERVEFQYFLHLIGKEGDSLIDYLFVPKSFPKISTTLVFIMTIIDVTYLISIFINFEYGIFAIITAFCFSLFFI